MTMTATQADLNDAATTFNGKVSNFERLTVTATGGETMNLTNLDGLSYVTTSGTGLTLTGMANAGTLSLTAASTAQVVTMTDATGTSDSFNILIGGTSNTATAYGSVTVASVETLTIASDDTAAAPAGVQHSLTVVDTAAKSITITGDAGVALTFAGTALTSLDASGVTKGAVAYTTGALAAASTLAGGAGNDTIDAALSTKAVTLNGNAGNDALTGSATIGSTINGGAGTDTLVGGTGADIIDGGADADAISSSTGLDILTGGAGNDTFNITTPLNGNSYATITDAAAGDIIDLSNKGTATWNGTKITLAGTAAFQDYLDAATAGDGSTNGINRWFTYLGDTYIVQDISALSTFVNGADTVVKLTGEHDLSTSATTIVAATSTITLGG
jgi:Ca2+-binding RTX toxin-like protein